MLFRSGALSGASEDVLDAYRRFGVPVGEAFQLRDDVLGVFGDPARTGKPAGDDLREGKRTVLVAYALALGGPSAQELIAAGLGREDLDDDGVSRLRVLIEDSGALAATETLIDGHTQAAFDALEQMPVDGTTRAALRSLAHAAVTRTA